ncbi:2OG-Fe dioxygenase family protein [Sphaerisporangium sp. TRM90804]|uniref:2OG-Fe dioxygenase family protein n=1 Tax=Sphaerisporangium sp. TRM90804 TaxID=3031113 RepID=UPI002448EA3D|nr:2OG-Fe dioxygenase family protein [Sphaerisporangium sp. TRM90804]MDH2428353.1 2OG-Fe dioxygenase family protein [Sphaerisporangium sp. TRM90804]
MLLTEIREDLRAQGYSLVRAADLPIDPALRRHATALAGEWDHLETDKYLKDGARFRERRYDRFYYLPKDGTIRLRPHRPYFQSMTANEYAGGIARSVAQLTESTLANPLLPALLEFDFAQFPVTLEQLEHPWDVQCHQFRIISTPEELGDPTPEGPHRDEVDFGAIHLMSRTNAAGGLSQVYTNGKELVTEFALDDLMDTMFWSDQQVLHAVTPIVAENPALRAVRDVLILGYKCTPGLRETD